MSDTKTISVVIPVYNNASSLEILHERLRSVITSYNASFLHEFIFVNDGSTDNSLEVLKKIRASDDRVVVIDFSRNFGQLAGILAGWQAASGDAVINMSADLQDPPEQVAKMLERWENGNEIIICYRQTREDKFTTVLTSRIAYSLFRISVPSFPPGGFDFALLDRKAMDAVNSIKERNRFFQADILWVGFNICYLPYKREKRKHGKSAYTFSRRLGGFVAAFVTISHFPIRLISFLGLLTAFFGFLYSLGIVYAYFHDNTPFTGWAPIMMLILIIGGILMIMLGIIGEYIWRIYEEVRNRPNFIIRDKF
ncbi:glycosyltransferase family 2 protein [bacterium]|nr:glycosyltransferase family 2 protein [bacterium]